MAASPTSSLRWSLPIPAQFYLPTVVLGTLGICLTSHELILIGSFLLALALAGLGVGQKFEIDDKRQHYRQGLHWANIINPAWQVLPTVQSVLIKPHSSIITPGRLHLVLIRRVTEFIVLLSVPDSQRGVVVASISSNNDAIALAKKLALALTIPVEIV